MRTNKGAIQISRSIYNSEIWHKPSDWIKIWIYLLGNVNFKDNNDFQRGENFFRYEIIALDCGVSYNTVVKCIKYLKLATQVQVKKTTRGAIISVCNYDKYQKLDNYGNTEATQKQDKSNRKVNTIIEESKNEKNVRSISKEIITEVIEAPPSYGKKEINDILIFLYTAVGIQTFKETQKTQRQYGNHFVKLIEKIGKQDFIERLKGILGDDFKRKNCNSAKYLYNEMKSYIHLQPNGIKRC